MFLSLFSQFKIFLILDVQCEKRKEIEKNGSFTHLKRAVAKDRGEDGSGQHGEDGQDHRHAVCGGGDGELLLLRRLHMKDMKNIASKGMKRTNS